MKLRILATVALTGIFAVSAFATTATVYCQTTASATPSFTQNVWLGESGKSGVHAQTNSNCSQVIESARAYVGHSTMTSTNTISNGRGSDTVVYTFSS